VKAAPHVSGVLENTAMRALIAALLFSAILLQGADAQPVETRKVLFVGNSLTIANGLAAMVEALSRADGAPIQTGVVAFSGYSLEDHWDRGDARRALAAGGWSTVVLQQGPSSQQAGRDMLIDFAELFAREAGKVKARVALYMVWPPRSGPGSFGEVSNSYAQAARSVKGLLLPVGDAFAAALKSDRHIAILGPDGFHPTPLGTYLAAVVIYQHLAGRATPFVPRKLESPTEAFPEISLTPEIAAQLESAAAAAR
jgi:hypothetical protein